MIIGGGLVGVELLGELTAFVDEIAPLYNRVNRNEVRFIMLQGGERIMPEMNPIFADYGTRVLSQRPGVEIRTQTRVCAIEPGRVHLPEETIEAGTIILAAGIVPNPIVASLPVSKDKHGHIQVDATMRCQTKPEVWAIGDCASIPAPDGKPYPNLAQHALREAKVLARNLVAVLDGRPPRPFIYDNLGMMGSLGHGKAFGQLLKAARSWRPGVARAAHVLPASDARLGPSAAHHGQLGLCAFFRPDIVKLSLDSEAAMLLRNGATGKLQSVNEEPATAPAEKP